MNPLLHYKNGQSLAYAEYGDKTGYPILIHHGLIASINDSALFARLIHAGRRLICIARPGYGQSSPYRMANMAEWGEIVATLVEALNLAHFDILGISSGAPYCYAIGSKLPEKVRSIYILSGIPALYDKKIRALWPYPLNKRTSLAKLKQVARELFFTNLSPADLQQPGIRDSMMNNCFGLALDWKIRCLDWGFTLAEVPAPVYMRHSELDPSVPFTTARLTAELLPNCQLEAMPGDVHFSAAALDDFIRTTLRLRVV